MRIPRLVCIAAALLTGAALAQQAPSEVTDGEIAKYKKAAYEGCREPGLAQKHPEATVNEFCSCMIATLDKEMKRTEWQQAYFYWVKKQDAEAQAVLNPHKSKLAACRPK